MANIKLITIINSTQKNCFDLSRDIDLHVKSMEGHQEEAIGGRKSGFIELGEVVTWSAKHFGLNFKMTIKITSMQQPISFIDEMIKGPFKRLKHTHQFIALRNQTKMIDLFEFEAPFGIIGKIAESLWLNRYMKGLLIERNKLIKKIAEE